MTKSFTKTWQLIIAVLSRKKVYIFVFIVKKMCTLVKWAAVFLLGGENSCVDFAVRIAERESHDWGWRMCQQEDVWWWQQQQHDHPTASYRIQQAACQDVVDSSWSLLSFSALSSLASFSELRFFSASLRCASVIQCSLFCWQPFSKGDSLGDTRAIA